MRSPSRTSNRTSQMLLAHPGFVHPLEPAKDAVSTRRRSSPPEPFQRGGPKGRNDAWIQLCESRGDDRKHLPYMNSSRLSLLLLLLLFIFLQVPAGSLNLRWNRPRSQQLCRFYLHMYRSSSLSDYFLCINKDHKDVKYCFFLVYFVFFIDFVGRCIGS